MKGRDQHINADVHMYLPWIWHLLNWEFNRLLSNKHKPPWKAWILIGPTGQSFFIYLFTVHFLFLMTRSQVGTQTGKNMLELHKWNMSKPPALSNLPQTIYVDTLAQFSLKHERAAAPEDYRVCFPMQWRSQAFRGWTWGSDLTAFAISLLKHQTSCIMKTHCWYATRFLWSSRWEIYLGFIQMLSDWE